MIEIKQSTYNEIKEYSKMKITVKTEPQNKEIETKTNEWHENVVVLKNLKEIKSIIVTFHGNDLETGNRIYVSEFALVPFVDYTRYHRMELGEGS